MCARRSPSERTPHVRHGPCFSERERRGKRDGGLGEAVGGVKRPQPQENPAWLSAEHGAAPSLTGNENEFFTKRVCGPRAHGTSRVSPLPVLKGEKDAMSFGNNLSGGEEPGHDEGRTEPFLTPAFADTPRSQITT